jgi:formylglycine-generating enzyme
MTHKQCALSLFLTVTFAAFSQPITGPLGIRLVQVDGGSLSIASSDISERHTRKSYPRTLTVATFYIGQYEIRQDQYASVMGTNPSDFKGDALPVQTVNWFTALDFCNRLSLIEGLSPCYEKKGTDYVLIPGRNGYRLPMAAEWEYAAHGGAGGKSFLYSGSDVADEVAWYDDSSGTREPRPVGGKKPNELGLYDMSGNVWEWCWDAIKGDQGKDTAFRVIKGGCFGTTSWYCCPEVDGYQFATAPYKYIGLRVVRSEGGVK